MDRVMPTGNDPGPGAQRVHGQSVGPDQGVVHGEVADVLVLQARRVDADGVAQHGDDVGLVEGAGPSDEVAEMGDGALDVAGEALGRVGSLPAAAVGEPARRREVVEGDHRGDAALVTGRAHAPVVVEGGRGELPFGGLDPAPLQREAVGAEAEVGHEVDVLGPAMERVTGVAARCDTSRVGVVLPVPPVVVDVAAFDLVRGRGRSPQEPVGEREGLLGRLVGAALMAAR